jgi:iron only hydrogenase large subunit-like protein
MTAVRGRETKTLVLLAVALLLANTPCLAACIACSSRSAVLPCHHKAPRHNDNKQPCPHQLFRAMAPSNRAAQSPTPGSWRIEVQAIAEPPNAPVVLLGPVIGLSPPRSDLTPILTLRV